MASLFTISCVAINAVHQTASRMTWSFARDDALFGSRWLGVVHEELNVPIYALVVNGVVVLLVGIVYVCSSTGIPSFLPFLDALQSMRVLIGNDSIQRIHKHNCNSRPNLLRHPSLPPPPPSTKQPLPPPKTTLPRPRCYRISGEHHLCGVGCGRHGVFHLSYEFSGYGGEYEYASFSPFTLFEHWLGWVVLTDSRLCFGCVGGYVDIRDWELVCSCEVVLSWSEVGVVYTYD